MELSGPISKSLEQNEHMIRYLFENCYDIAFRRIQIFGQIDVLLVYLDGLVDTNAIDNLLLTRCIRYFTAVAKLKRHHELCEVLACGHISYKSRGHSLNIVDGW
ncbi:hypothetical protein AB4Z21_01550 [Paenibacillus sp. MCAF20]